MINTDFSALARVTVDRLIVWEADEVNAQAMRFAATPDLLRGSILRETGVTWGARASWFHLYTVAWTRAERFAESRGRAWYVDANLVIRWKAMAEACLLVMERGA